MMRAPEITGRLDFEELQTGGSLRMLIGNINSVIGPCAPFRHGQDKRCA